MVALRRIDGVADVTLATSQVTKESSGSASTTKGGCGPKGSQFSMTLKFRAPAAAATTTAAPASAGSTP
jgi:hypothetical protein